ncbi:unnamed protein product, partial [Phaeothamnion confervicola]
MRSGGEQREWRNGEALILDTSFEHETRNNATTAARYVMIVDFWHPQLTSPEQEALAFVYDLRNRYDSGLVPTRPTVARPAQG